MGASITARVDSSAAHRKMIGVSRWRREAIGGDQIGAGGIWIGVLIFVTHVDAFAPELAEEARAREQVSKNGIEIKDVDAA